MQHDNLGSTDFYDVEARTYDERRWQSLAGRHVNEVQIGIVCELAGDVHGSSVLDIATGTGRFALTLARRGAKVTALDSSQSMLDVAEKKCAEAGLDGDPEFVSGLASELPFPDESFDLCVCINALNHIPQYRTVIAEIHRVLKYGGQCITNYTNWVSPYLPFGVMVNMRRKSITRDVYTKWFSPREVYELHRSLGLQPEAVRGAVQIPSFLHSTTAVRAMVGIDNMFRNSGYAPLMFVKATKEKTRNNSSTDSARHH